MSITVPLQKNLVAPTPPMGWNSWDCFGASVNEAQLMANAQFMADHLKAHGWQYVVCDIQWSDPTADSTEYHPFTPLCMDGYSRLMPAPERFPSAANGAGFTPIATRIHDMGLKFGIHMMRGIPRQAVHQDTPILGSDARARAIAQPWSLCPWNTDMYGLNPDAAGAQAYYDSLFALYAAWGVDFVKVDDIANTEFNRQNPYSAAREIEMIRHAIDASGRDMVLSLSPGPAIIERAWHLSQHANMWRMTGDFWDRWPALLSMFERCEVWAPHVGPGCWPDCDMLPMGRLRCFEDGGQASRFTHDEQVTLMTLWCIFRSPLMFGGHLPDTDADTLALLTNDAVLRVLTHGHGARQMRRDAEHAVWRSEDTDGGIYVALFNLSDAPRSVGISWQALGITPPARGRDLWQSTEIPLAADGMNAMLPAHGALLARLDG